ncbi:hypothetical protein TNCT_570311 [Trichonephila clavata]|uniref:Uncharacterized protein n=1 Tax=Trichonephila clavata TaxID=2740835 RepID=A0A8X6F3R7_TRICU|nr:hypothetical protein TNCT_570311 [Trichonephila clavata]
MSRSSITRRGRLAVNGGGRALGAGNCRINDVSRSRMLTRALLFDAMSESDAVTFLSYPRVSDRAASMTSLTSDRLHKGTYSILELII